MMPCIEGGRSGGLKKKICYDKRGLAKSCFAWGGGEGGSRKKWFCITRGIRKSDKRFFHTKSGKFVSRAIWSLLWFLGDEGNQEIPLKKKQNSKNRNKVCSLVTEWGNLTRTWPLPDRDSPEQEQGDITWSCLGVVSRKRSSLICNNVCIISHL